MGDFETIRGKRRSVSLPRLEAKAAEGNTTGDERALVRLGKTNTKILTGQEDLTLWSKEELLRGQRQDRNGRWQGRAPKVVPKAIHDELVRRTLSEAQSKLTDSLVDAVEALADIVKGKDVEDKDRITAAKLIIDRVMGRVPEKIDLRVGEKPKWETALEAVLVPTDADAAEIIDVDFVEKERMRTNDDTSPFDEPDD